MPFAERTEYKHHQYNVTLQVGAPHVCKSKIKHEQLNVYNRAVQRAQWLQMAYGRDAAVCTRFLLSG